MTAPPSTSRTPRTTRSAASPKLCRSERKDSRTVTQPRCKNSLKIMLRVSEIYVVCGLVVRKASEALFCPFFWHCSIDFLRPLQRLILTLLSSFPPLLSSRINPMACESKFHSFFVGIYTQTTSERMPYPTQCP